MRLHASSTVALAEYITLIAKMVQRKIGHAFQREHITKGGKERLINATATCSVMSHADQEQISAEQILKQVYEKRKTVEPSTKVDILDLEELKEYQRRKRSEYEGYLKRNRLDIGQWIRYAQFEVDQHDVRRARSIFERALQVSKTNIPLWIRYIDTELKLKYINHARNILDRAISTLPRVDKLWYKYLLVEESLEQYDMVRALFAKWISLEPVSNAWDSFVDFEIRQSNLESVRQIYTKYVMVHPQSETWFKWLYFEKVYGSVESIRRIYSLAVDTLISFQNVTYENDTIKLIISFINWEASQQEFERCRALLKISIQRWPKNQTLKNESVSFEKRFGDANLAEYNVACKRRWHYENKLKEKPRDYDTWWLYLDLVENTFVRDMPSSLEKSVTESNPNDVTKTTAWKQYILLWIRYLTYVELDLGDISLCRNLYKRLINEIIPHKKFTFSKVWMMYAKFEIRQGDIQTARKILGRSLGMYPKKKTYKEYISLEIKMKDFDRVRKIYEKLLEFRPEDVETWVDYAELEENLGDDERSRGIYEIALKNATSSFPQEARAMLLERYIEFENDAEEFGRARELYERYLVASGYSPKVWISYALYESSAPTEAQLEAIQHSREQQEGNGEAEEEEDSIEFEITEENRRKSRSIFERALKYFREHDEPANRIIILKGWMSYEEVYGIREIQNAVSGRMPKTIMKENPDGTKELKYIFSDDKNDRPNTSKLLTLARKWQEEQESKNGVA